MRDDYLFTPNIAAHDAAAATGDYAAGYARRAFRWWCGLGWGRCAPNVEPVNVRGYESCAAMSWGELVRLFHTAVMDWHCGYGDLAIVSPSLHCDEYAALVVMVERIAAAAFCRGGGMRIAYIVDAVEADTWRSVEPVAPVDVRAMVRTWQLGYYTGDYGAKYAYMTFCYLVNGYGRDWGGRLSSAAFIPWVEWCRVRDLSYGELLRKTSAACTSSGWVSVWDIEQYAALVVMVERIAARACFECGGCDEN